MAKRQGFDEPKRKSVNKLQRIADAKRYNAPKKPREKKSGDDRGRDDRD